MDHCHAHLEGAFPFLDLSKHHEDLREDDDDLEVQRGISPSRHLAVHCILKVEVEVEVEVSHGRSTQHADCHLAVEDLDWVE